jgi:dipeptidyl aminopeptidase/acylaminoacyl peptidase
VCPAMAQAVWAKHDQRAAVPTAKLQPFTVADSIEMTHIIDPPENQKGSHPQFSPDGSKFLVVTERGRLDSNVREYSLLIYKTERLLSDAPVQVATFSSSSNRDGILQSRWLDNDRISLIGENPGETPQIYFVNCRNHQVERVTSDAFGVAAYDVSRDLKRVIYYASWGGDEGQNRYKDDHGFAVSSETLEDLIAGQWRRGSHAVYQLKIKNLSRASVQTVPALPFLFPASRLALWLSPDGRHAITEQPAFRVPAGWESYEDKLVSSRAHQQKVDRRQIVRPFSITQLMLVDTETAEIKPLVEAPAPTVPTVVWSANSKSVIVAGTYLPLDSDRREELATRRSLPVVAEFDISSGAFRRIADIPKDQAWRIEESGLRDRFRVGVAKVDEVERIESLEFRREGSGWVREDQNHADQDRGPNVTITEALDHWPKLEILDPITHSQGVLLDPNPQFRNRQFGRVETIRWTGKRGEPLSGGLVYPTNYVSGPRCPLVIQTHGFDPNAFLLDGSYTTAMAAQELANRGIAVLQIGESPLYEQSQGTLDFGPANLSQLESAVDNLDHLGIIDRDRVGLVGFSITGFHVLYALAHSNYHFSAAISAEGNDFGYWQYVISDSPGWAASFERPYGGPPWSANWKPWMEDSITFSYDNIHTPLRLESESNRTVAYEWEKFQALRRLRRPVELFFLPGGAHILVRPWDRMASLEGTLDWMTFWLKGEEDPDPAKVDQYARWHELRRLQEADVKASVAAQ